MITIFRKTSNKMVSMVVNLFHLLFLTTVFGLENNHAVNNNESKLQIRRRLRTTETNSEKRTTIMSDRNLPETQDKKTTATEERKLNESVTTSEYNLIRLESETRAAVIWSLQNSYDYNDDIFDFDVCSTYSNTWYVSLCYFISVFIFISKL